MENKVGMLKYIECLKENFELKDIVKWKEFLLRENDGI
jgi:hypothetical protein